MNTYKVLGLMLVMSMGLEAVTFDFDIRIKTQDGLYKMIQTDNYMDALSALQRLIKESGRSLDSQGIQEVLQVIDMLDSHRDKLYYDSEVQSLAQSSFLSRHKGKVAAIALGCAGGYCYYKYPESTQAALSTAGQTANSWLTSMWDKVTNFFNK